jgi:transglutaminase-like putative cysteine protease
MTLQTRWLLVWVTACSLYFPTGISARTAPSSQPPEATPVTDNSKEPYIIERSLVKTVFQNDGKYVQESTERIRIQSQAGLQRYGVLHLPYAYATSTADFLYVRTIKQNGTTLETPLSGVLDLTPEITVQAPSYIDIKDKQIAVKGVEVGDAIEFAQRIEVKTPLIPGQFWLAYYFSRDVVSLDEQVQIGVPRSRNAKVKSPDIQPTITDEGAVRYYNWKTKNLQKTKDTEDGDKRSLPSIQLTSFQTWDELGQWFRTLALPQAAVTPAIKAKADDLIAGAKTDTEKIRALYAFVSSNFRYVGISLGIGRYQPHAAAEVLANGFGDCKDKHTLLAALLRAEGIKAYPVLIGSAQKLDPDVPSPFWFDHLITAISQPGSTVFLDTTAEIGPFAYLLPNLRDVQALAMPDGTPAALVRTPADPPFRSLLSFGGDGALDESGTFTGKMQLTLRGDDEIVYRAVYRASGQSQWMDVTQKLSSNFGYTGTVSDVNVTAPGATDAPFQISYGYSEREYGDWANKRTWPPFPAVFLPEAKEPSDSSTPRTALKLGSPKETIYEASMRLPKDSNPDVPGAVDLHEFFADYHAEYAFADGKMHFQRHLTTKVREVPVDQLDAYRTFYKAIQDDASRLIPLSKPISQSPAPGSPAVEALLNQALDAIQKRDNARAVDLGERIVQLAPDLARAWGLLAMAHFAMNNLDSAASDLKRVVSLDASQPLSEYRQGPSGEESRGRCS